MAAEVEEVTGQRREDGGGGTFIRLSWCVCVSRNFPHFYPYEDKMFSQGCEDEDVKMCHSAASTKRSGLRFGGQGGDVVDGRGGGSQRNKTGECEREQEGQTNENSPNQVCLHSSSNCAN